jgi:hypothetical protein
LAFGGGVVGRGAAGSRGDFARRDGLVFVVGVAAAGWGAIAVGGLVVCSGE